MPAENIGKCQEISKGGSHLAWHDIASNLKHDLTPNLDVVDYAIGNTCLFERIEDNTINCAQSS